MNRIFLIVFLSFFASTSFGQRAGGHVSGGGAHYSGTGSVNHGYYGHGGGYGGRGYGRSAVYAIPFYGGYFGDYGLGYDSGSYDSSVGTLPSAGLPYGPGDQQAPPQQAAPPVIINQYFATPPQPGPGAGDPDQGPVQTYQQQTQPGYAPAGEPRSYLIAFKDHSVYTALAYWVEGNTFHYVTTQNTHNQAEVSQVDVELTKKLNQDRTLPFTMPATPGPTK